MTPSAESEAAGSAVLGHHVVVCVGAFYNLAPAEKLTAYMMQSGSEQGSDKIPNVLVVAVMYTCGKM